VSGHEVCEAYAVTVGREHARQLFGDPLVHARVLGVEAPHLLGERVQLPVLGGVRRLGLPLDEQVDGRAQRLGRGRETLHASPSQPLQDHARGSVGELGDLNDARDGAHAEELRRSGVVHARVLLGEEQHQPLLVARRFQGRHGTPPPDQDRQDDVRKEDEVPEGDDRQPVGNLDLIFGPGESGHARGGSECG
jgi:hypothetical protein